MKNYIKHLLVGVISVAITLSIQADPIPLANQVLTNPENPLANQVLENPENPLANQVLENGGYPGGELGMPPMTEDDLIKWQQEVDAQINQYVSTLTPNEQEQFHKDVAEMAEKMNTMTEEELTQFINTMFSEAATSFQEEQAAIAESVQEPIVPQEEQPKAALETDRKKAAHNEKIMKLLNNLITRIERLLRKISRMPDFSGKLEKWITQDKIKEWQATLTWEKMRHDLEVLVQLLHTLRDSSDPKTKKPRYFDDLIQDEELFTMLTNVSATLTAHEPNIEVPEVGKSLTTSTKNALKAVLSALAKSLYTEEINTKISKLIEKYEPRAKILREEEEAFKKKTFEESKRPRQEAFRKEVGTGRNRYAMPETGGSLADYYGGSNYSAPSGGYSYGGGYAHPADYEAYEPAPAKATPSEPSAGGGGAAAPSGGKGGGGASVPGATGKDKEPKKEGRTPSEGHEPEHGEKAGAKASMEDRKANRQLDVIQNNLESALEIAENDTFKKLDTIVTREPINVGLVNQINEFTSYVKKSMREIKEFGSSIKSMPAATKDAYSKELKSIIKGIGSALETLDKNLATLAKQKSSLSPAKKYAYYAEGTEAVAVQEAPALAGKKPANLELLSKEIDDFNKTTYSYMFLM